jgi:hypothetical protein
MEVAAVELASNPMDKLLAKYVEALGIRQIERLLDTILSPSPVANSKKRRLNMSVTLDDQYDPYYGQNGPQRHQGPDQSHNAHGSGHDHYNKNFK